MAKQDSQTIQGVAVNTLQPLSTKTILPDLTGKSAKDVTIAMWNIKPSVAKEVGNISRVYSSKHGMFASVPIICRGENCTFKNVCMVDDAQRIIGQRCPMEIAAILSRYELWCNHFDIDTSQDTIDPHDLVDATLIKDLVNVEVQMMRVENKIALNGDFMADTLLDIDRKCTPYYGKVVAPEVELLMSLHNQKIKILNQLNATRKDKASDKSQNAASDMAIRIFQQVQAMDKSKNVINITDINFNDDGEVVEPQTQEITIEGESDGTR